MEKSFELSSFLTYDEVDILLKFYSILPKTLNYGNDKKAYTTGFDLDTLDKTPIKNFKTRLTNIIGQHKVTVSMFLEEFEPWTVHSDYHKADNKPYYALLFPLDYENKDTHTITFNELGIEEDYKKNLLEESGYDYDQKQLRLLSHVDQQLLKKLTIDKIFKWQKGNMIAWHRSLLHCSDNFLLDGPQKKTALVLFLNRDD